MLYAAYLAWMRNPARVHTFRKVKLFHFGNSFRSKTDLKDDRKKIFDMMSMQLRTERTWSAAISPRTRLIIYSAETRSIIPFIRNVVHSYFSLEKVEGWRRGQVRSNQIMRKIESCLHEHYVMKFKQFGIFLKRKSWLYCLLTREHTHIPM